ncbi:retrovirus-related pol polyprotein from transposon TNT 1-94 [Tanacetum coccineum]
MDLFGPSVVRSYGGNRYTLVIVDDYSRLLPNSKAYIILNKHTKKIEKLLNVTFDETPSPSKTSPLVDDDLDEEESIRETEKKNLENVVEDETLEIDEIVNIKESRNHPLENIIGNLNQRTLRSQAQNQSNFFCFISTIKPKNMNEALGDESWIVVMQEELNQFVANDVWGLVTQPRNMKIIGTKWVFRNKLDENGVVSRNKARLVAQCYNQQEGIDYDETYAQIARLESIRILLAYACALDFKLFQMDVKSAFLNGFINEEYIKEMLKKFGLEDSKPMKTPMSSDTKLTKDEECDSVDSTKYRGMIGTTHLGLWHPKGIDIETIVYADSDHAGDYVDRKSTSGKRSQQALWMKQALIDYDIRLNDVPIMCDNKGAIDLSKNLMQHSRTKHIEIRHHFLRDNVQKGHISIEKVSSVDNITDILTKPLKHESFNYLRLGLGMMEHISQIILLHLSLFCLNSSPCSIPQYRLSYSDKGQMFIEFVIQNQNFSLSLEDFAQILRIPCEDLEGQVTRIRHQEEVEVQDYQILTREIVLTLKPLEEIIRENVLCLGGNKDHVPACLCYMLYCVANSEKFNLAYFMAKRMECVTKQARLILPYDMLLTRLFDFIIGENFELQIESYLLYDRVMNPLAAQLEQKPRRDRGTRRGRQSTSSSTFDQPSSSHLNDDDDDNGNDEGTSRASTPSPIRYVNSLTNQVPQVFQNPPNIDPQLEPFYTRQTEIINRQVQL